MAQIRPSSACLYVYMSLRGASGVPPVALRVPPGCHPWSSHGPPLDPAWTQGSQKDPPRGPPTGSWPEPPLPLVASISRRELATHQPTSRVPLFRQPTQRWSSFGPLQMPDPRYFASNITLFDTGARIPRALFATKMALFRHFVSGR